MQLLWQMKLFLAVVTGQDGRKVRTKVNTSGTNFNNATSEAATPIPGKTKFDLVVNEGIGVNIWTTHSAESRSVGDRLKWLWLSHSVCDNCCWFFTCPHNTVSAILWVFCFPSSLKTKVSLKRHHGFAALLSMSSTDSLYFTQSAQENEGVKPHFIAQITRLTGLSWRLFSFVPYLLYSTWKIWPTNTSKPTGKLAGS